MAEDMDVGMKCIKYMLFVANFMFVMIGFLLISIGSTVKAIYEDFEAFMSLHYYSPSSLAIAIGVIIFFVALFGCVGALKESTCLINLFALCMTLVLILEIAASIAAYAMRSQIETTLRINMEDALDDYIMRPNRYEIDAWDFTQETLHCCGVDEFSDWEKPRPPMGPKPPSKDFLNDTDLFQGPLSCCRYPELTTPPRCSKHKVYKQGCLGALTYIVSESALLLGCGALAVAFIQVLGIIFAHMLAKAVRRLKTNDLVEQEQNRQQLYEQLAKNQTEVPTPVLYTPTFSEA